MVIDAEVSKSGSQAVLKMSDTVSIKLPADKSAKLFEGGYEGKTVVVGIRPEDVKDDEAFIAANPDSKFKATIKVYELYFTTAFLKRSNGVFLYIRINI